MPASYRIDRAAGVVLSRAWGLFTADEAREHYARLRLDPDFDPSFRQLADMRDVTGLALTSGTVRHVAETSPFARGTRRAMVVATEEAYGTGRMLSLYSELEGQRVEIFREWESALAWLGLPEGFSPSEER